MKKILPIFFILVVFSLIGAACSKSNTPVATPKVTDTKATYSMTEVAAANNKDKCWTVIEGQVYDITTYINRHPGGEQNIVRLCGVDGTQAFQGKHGGQDKPKNILDSFKIGALK